ncbi:hypothetical protein IZ6_23370 [Terrihabitans soli]|uniref:Uncharacterized protein n=1 Tax=Terrihabitans soli TaxID=708113 RepID=A0A6S6QWI4_9HYPH|nr:hypothetical protein [Terrihabitans soli]BCJ91602.1 hypothetical protein IZ6_23370 [Terrihabitans soli]
MKTWLLALLVCAAPLAAAEAETSVTGFNPRFSTPPSNMDPNYRPPYEPESRLDVTIDVDPFRWRDRDRRPCRNPRSCRN